jgi:hypothetical protein
MIVQRRSLSNLTPPCAATLLAIALLLLVVDSIEAAGPYRLDIPFRSSLGGVVEVYYDTGGGFTKNQRSSRVVHASSTMQTLHFDLPAGIQIKLLRLDPLNGAGSFEIGPVTIEGADGRPLCRLALSAYQARKELNIISKGPDILQAEAPLGSRDPIFIINLPHPLDLPMLDAHGKPTKARASKVSDYDWPAWMDGGLIALALVMLGAAVFSRRGPPAERSFNWHNVPRLQWVDRIASILTDSELIIFNRVSIVILLSALTVFILFCAFRLHGSATSIWDYHIAGETPHNGLLWGHPKGIRSDEITVFTPDIFSQVYSETAFSSKNRTVGGAQSVFFWSFPVNHFIEIPRFYLWPFHILPIDWAFSVYWNLKGLILFVGSYLLLLLLTGSRAWLSAAGALWIYFSGFTQWWFSHCLPESIGFAALTLVGALYLMLSRKRLLVYAGAIVLALSLLNFALIFYPPFTIPLGWVMLSAGLGIFIEKRKLLLGPDPLKVRWVLLAIVLAICGATLGAFLLEAQGTVQMIRQTVYPGQRFNVGGSETLLTFFISFIDSVFTENHVPAIASNICTGTHYYLIGLLVLPVILITRRGHTRFSVVDALLTFCVLMLVVFMVVGFPHWLAGATLLSASESKRAKIGVGLAAIFLQMRYFSRTSRGRRIEAEDWQLALSLLALLSVTFVFFQTTSAYALPGRAIAMLLAVNAALVLFAVSGQAGRFFAVMLALLLTHNYLINPIATGFTAVTRKNLYQEVCKIRRSGPAAKWVVFGPFQIGNFLKFCGVEVISGNKFYPVFEYNNLLDPQHHYINIWNSYSHVGFVDSLNSSQAYYEEVPGPVYRVDVAANSPALAGIGVRYCLLTYPPPEGYLPAVIKRVRDGSKNYWIVRRDLLPTVPGLR